MGTTVQVKSGRLMIQANGKLVRDLAGDFVDADTNDRFIVVLLKSGRVQLLRPDGRFIADLATRADGGPVKIAGDDTVTWSEGGREQRRKVAEYERALVRSNVKSFTQARNAEELGAVFGDRLADAITAAVSSIWRAIKGRGR